MDIIENNSSYSISCLFALSSLDRECFSLLYLPIIGYKSYALYLALYDRKNLDEDEVLLNEDLIKDLCMTESDFIINRKRLESIKLLQVYRKEVLKDGVLTQVNYMYKLIPPASPKKFFNDPLLKALLLRCIGQRRFNTLLMYYKVNNTKIDESYKDITASFDESFDISKDDILNTLSYDGDGISEKRYEKSGKISKEELIERLKELIDIKSIDIDSLFDFISLYPVTIDECIDVFKRCMDSDDVFYFDIFKKEIRKNLTVASDDKAEVVKGKKTKFDNFSPVLYLEAYYNAKPSPFMLDEVEKLKSDFHFSDGMINIILDYCLKKSNDEFRENFIDRVAYTLAGKKINNSYDAAIALNSRDFEIKKSYKKKKVVKKEEDDEADVSSFLQDIDL